MLEQDAFVIADRGLQRVVGQISDDQWTMQMPADFVRRDQRPTTLREVINYHASDDAWVPDMLAGRTMDEVGREAFAGDLLGEDPQRSFAAIVDRACAAAEALTDPEQTVHCSFGDYSARDYLHQANYFRGIRAHDIARVIGVDATLPNELVAALWDELRPHAQEWRAIGVFGPEVEVAEDAPLQSRLLALTGRRP